MQSSMKHVAGTLLGALLTVTAVTGCSTSTPPAAPAVTAEPSATPTPDDWYEMHDGTQVDIYADQPLPDVIIPDAQAALQETVAALAAANLPANGSGSTPEQRLVMSDAEADAQTLQKRLSDASGRTALVVSPLYGSIDGENYMTVWAVTPWMDEHSVMASEDKDTVTAAITAWAEQAGPEYFVVAP